MSGLPSNDIDNNNTICPRSSDPFYTVTCYIEWITTPWTETCIIKQVTSLSRKKALYLNEHFTLVQLTQFFLLT